MVPPRRRRCILAARWMRLEKNLQRWRWCRRFRPIPETAVSTGTRSQDLCPTATAGKLLGCRTRPSSDEGRRHDGPCQPGKASPRLPPSSPAPLCRSRRHQHSLVLDKLILGRCGRADTIGRRAAAAHLLHDRLPLLDLLHVLLSGCRARGTRHNRSWKQQRLGRLEVGRGLRAARASQQALPQRGPARGRCHAAHVATTRGAPAPSHPLVRPAPSWPWHT